MTTERMSYVEPTQDSGRALIQRAIAGEVVMLNLLRFRKVADYSANPELAPATPIQWGRRFPAPAPCRASAVSLEITKAMRDAQGQRERDRHRIRLRRE